MKLILAFILGLVATASAKTNYLKSHLIQFGPSDYYIDFWQDQMVLNDIKLLGFTNLHTLYVDAHGGYNGICYVITPHKSRYGKWKYPAYSVESMAKAVGSGATNIHNFYLGACNKDGKFNPQHVLHYFPNVTNIVYNPYGIVCYETFLQSITTESHSVSYKVKCDGVICRPLVSNLYLPGQKKPYLTKVAGRENLYPNFKLVYGNLRDLFETNNINK